ncbi:hypothetical protein [Bifidobacterium tissieri]|uniref:Histidine kinase n=1 Tax=Bifidobacterium tissieri TaxID=1630162 RepID=A0A5M9ZT30_9BIFI|nr:hypothetical protein [Bifidobacterium tissieri]KAA8827879.1 hypothetical protein EMO89_10090 [Bifidobacterium tissieri]KAA8830002.1 hypothetical protein EM849_10800 [Bifidobacterium tissieri]
MISQNVADANETPRKNHHGQTSESGTERVNRAARFIRTHRLRIGALALAIVFSLLDWYPLWSSGTGLPKAELMVMAVLIISLLIAMIDLRWGAVLTALVVMSSVLTGGVLGSSWANWAQYVMIGLLAFEINAASAAALGALSIASAVGFVSRHSWMSDMSLAGWLGSTMMLAMPLFIGLAFRWRADAQRAEARLLARQRELAQLRRDMQLVHMLHDSVAGRLSCVAAFSEQQCDAGEGSGTDGNNADRGEYAETAAWQLVNQETVQSLHSVWRAVRILSDNSSALSSTVNNTAVDDCTDGAENRAAALLHDRMDDHAEGPTGVLPCRVPRVSKRTPDGIIQRITQTAEDWRHRLELLNVHGDVQISGDAAECDEQVCELVEQFLGELFVNILKYARRSDSVARGHGLSNDDPDDLEHLDYLIMITFSGNDVRIMQTNGIAEANTVVRPHSQSVGSEADANATTTGAQAGLAYYRQQFDIYGGSLSYAIVDDGWMLQAVLPNRARVHV